MRPPDDCARMHARTGATRSAGSSSAAVRKSQSGSSTKSSGLEKTLLRTMRGNTARRPATPRSPSICPSGDAAVTTASPPIMASPLCCWFLRSSWPFWPPAEATPCSPCCAPCGTAPWSRRWCLAACVAVRCRRCACRTSRRPSGACSSATARAATCGWCPSPNGSSPRSLRICATNDLRAATPTGCSWCSRDPTGGGRCQRRRGRDHPPRVWSRPCAATWTS